MATVVSIAASHAAESLRLLHWVPGIAALSVTPTQWLTDRDPGHVANSIITAVGALSVAFLTIATADRRQDRQLEHEQISDTQYRGGSLAASAYDKTGAV